jgi:probable phosphoglycerate mutase
LLIRHALCDPVGHALSGRRPGVGLNAVGRAQAAGLGARLAHLPLAAVYASPLARSLETAAALARPHGMAPVREPALVELDFGAWTGRALDTLGAEPAWAPFNTYRSGTRVPAGELALEAQARAVGGVLRLAERHAGRYVAAVSHADVIKAVVGHLLGVPLDLQHRLEIPPASICALELHPWGPRVLAVGGDGTEWT